MIRDLDAVRERPGMYLGSPRSLNGENPEGLIHIAQEILWQSSVESCYNNGCNVIQKGWMHNGIIWYESTSQKVLERTRC